MLKQGIHRKYNADNASDPLGYRNAACAAWDAECQTSSTVRYLMPFLIKYKTGQSFVLKP